MRGYFLTSGVPFIFGFIFGGLMARGDAIAQEFVQSPSTIRFATFNIRLSKDAPEEAMQAIVERDAQVQALVRTLQYLRPDVVLLNELDRDSQARTVDLLREALAQGDNGLSYPFGVFEPSNTGEPTGIDIDANGRTSDPEDAYGWGEFPGQYAMALLSRLPILDEQVRTFQYFLWQDMPENLLPDEIFSPEAAQILRLSSKSHWDIPVVLPDQRIVHVLASHPTPPVFDGPEDANGRRNHDEIRFWLDYIDGAQYIYDDQKRFGGLSDQARETAFVIMGDLNNDPADGEGRESIMQRLLTHQRIHDPRPASTGAEEASRLQRGENISHTGEPSLDSADWRDWGSWAPGNLRVDYVLPSKDLEVSRAFVFWPQSASPLRRHLEKSGNQSASDHYPVVVDIRLESDESLLLP